MLGSPPDVSSPRETFVCCVAFHPEAGWTWISGNPHIAPGLRWSAVSTYPTERESRLKGKTKIALARAMLQTRRILKEKCDLIVSHGPIVAAVASVAARSTSRKVPHLCYGFNYTTLPQGASRLALSRALRGVSEFTVPSTMERGLYAQYFNLPPERFKTVLWGCNPPVWDDAFQPVKPPYFCAIGGEARDYLTLSQAARALPNVQFVIVVRSKNLPGLDMPGNVKVFVDLPYAQTWAVLRYATASIVPLESRQTPNGHVTIVNGMHLARPHIATNSSGITDYLADQKNAILTEERDATGIRNAIVRFLDEPSLALQFGEAGQTFSLAHCTERNVVEYFNSFVETSVWEHAH